MKTLGVFAHPDDEAFGPAGTIAKWARKDEVFLICLTDGNDAGVEKDLTEIRKAELEASARVLGVTKVFFFGYMDGGLCHNLYHEIAQKVQNLVRTLTIERLLTFEMRGVSGHLDHVAASMISSYVFDRTEEIKEIWYAGITQEHRQKMGDYFIYMPPGYEPNSFDVIEGVEDAWETKIQAIKKHQSQAKDMKNILNHYQELPKEEYFFVKRREG